jgi:hypothetical protein
VERGAHLYDGALAAPAGAWVRVRPWEPPVTWTHHCARVAVPSRDRASDDPKLLDERRKLREARLADYIKRTVNAFPPRTPEARGRLTVLLRDAAPEPNGSAGR